MIGKAGKPASGPAAAPSEWQLEVWAAASALQQEIKAFIDTPSASTNGVLTALFRLRAAQLSRCDLPRPRAES